MKKLLIATSIAAVLALVAIFVAVANLNGYLETNRETLVGLASDAAGRSVSFDRAEVAFSGGLAVRVVGLRVGEDPRFGAGEFLTFEEAHVGVRLFPALRGRVEVSGVRVLAPTLRLVRTTAGFNFESLGSRQGADAGSSPSPPREDAVTSLAVAIAALTITDGTISFRDRRSAEGLDIVIEDFQGSGVDLALDGPISLDFAGRARSNHPSDGEIASRVAGEVDLSRLDPLQGSARLRSPALHPAIFGVRLKEEGDVDRIDDLVIEVGLPSDPLRSGYPVTVRSSGARLAGFVLDDVSLDLNYREASDGAAVSLEEAAVGLAGGRVELAGDVLLGEPGASPFDLESTIRSIGVGPLASALLDLPPESISGTLEGDLALSGDDLEWEGLKRTLNGKLSLEVGEGALEQVNVLNRVVDRLSSDPGLGAIAAAAIRDVLPEELARESTRFDGIDLALEILDGTLRADELRIAAQDFGIEAAGQLGLDGSVAADGTFAFSEAISEKLVDRGGRFVKALERDGSVVVPLRIGGSVRSPSLMPDVESLSEDAGRQIQDEAAEKLTDAIFGKRKKGDAPDPERDAAKDLLREGLGRFLGR